MKHFMIKYQFASGTTEEWHREIGRFISALNNDPELKGKIIYRVMKNRDDSSYYHLAAAADEVLGIGREVHLTHPERLLAVDIAHNEKARDAGKRDDHPAVVAFREGRDPSHAAHPPQGKALSGRRFAGPSLGRRLHHADQAGAGQSVVNERKIARLEHGERERGARQEDGATQGEQRQRLGQVGGVAIAVGHPQEIRSLAVTRTGVRRAFGAP